MSIRLMSVVRMTTCPLDLYMSVVRMTTCSLDLYMSVVRMTTCPLDLYVSVVRITTGLLDLLSNVSCHIMPIYKNVFDHRFAINIFKRLFRGCSVCNNGTTAFNNGTNELFSHRKMQKNNKLFLQFTRSKLKTKQMHSIFCIAIGDNVIL